MKAIIKIILGICFITVGLALQAQHIVPASGIYHVSASGSISFIIGNLVTTTYTGTNTVLTPAIQQTNLSITKVQTMQDIDFDISIYPNPVNEFVRLKIKRDNLIGMNYQLYDINGKLLQKAPLEGNETLIPFNRLLPSTYFIKVMEGKRELETFRVVKY